MDVPFFLVALPQLQDEYFSRSVVLVGTHNEGGSFGLMINKPLLDEQNDLTQMVTEVKDLEGKTLFEFHEDVYEGGPVEEGSLFALHDISELAGPDSEISETLHLVSDPEMFQKLLEKDEYRKRRRFFLGYSSWTQGQLESEIRTGTWLPVSFDAKFLFEEVRKTPGSIEQWTESLWRRVLIAGGADPLTLMSPSSIDSGYN